MADESSAEEAAAQPASSVRQVFWIRQMLQRWQSAAAASAARRSSASAGASPTPTAAECAGRRVRVVVVEERGGGELEAAGSEPMTPMTPDAPADVPRGCCAVYVGAERRRFVVPTAYLGMPVFRRLLEKAEEEFGFDYHGGALTIPCDTEDFKYILVVMDNHHKGLVDDEGNPTEAAGASAGEPSSSSENRV